MRTVTDALVPFFNVATDETCSFTNSSIRLFSFARDIPCTATAYDYFMICLWALFFVALYFFIRILFDTFSDDMIRSRSMALKVFLVVALIIILTFFVVLGSVDVIHKQRVINQQTKIIESKEKEVESTKTVLEEIRKEIASLRDSMSSDERTTVEEEEVIEEPKKKVVVPDEPDEEPREKIDYDKDGLDFEDEEALGTSDFSADTDKDGINDADDPNPTKAGRPIEVLYEFEYLDDDYEVSLEVSPDYYEYLKSSPRVKNHSAYFMPKDPYIKSIADQLDDHIDDELIKCEHCFVVSFLHSLDAVTGSAMNKDSRIKYPMETLMDAEEDEWSDSEDTAFFAASLFDALGYDTLLIYHPKHAAIALNCRKCGGTFYDFEGEKYYYFESADDEYDIGRVPPSFFGVDVSVFPLV